jgi:carboxylesterase
MSRGSEARGSLRGEGVAARLEARGQAPSVLALHGFTGTPQEVALVVDVAQELGLSAVAPLLPGHGGRVADLAPLGFADWLAAAEAEYARLAEHGPVVVAGLSMGSLLALKLAARHPDTTAGVIAISNAMWLKRPWPTWPLWLIDHLPLPDFWLSKSAPDIADQEQRARHLTYNAQPVRAAISLLRAGEALAEELQLVKAKTLLLHGALDRVAPVENAWRVAVRLGTTDKRTVIFERSHHILTRDVERDAVRAELRRFLREVASAQRPVEP